MNLINSNGAPNENYEKFRDLRVSRTLMASLLKEAYSKLYLVYPEAHKESNDTLKNWFRAEMGVGDAAANQAARTFLTLSEFADFERVEIRKIKEKKEIESEIDFIKKIKEEPSQSLVINVNIQLALPATENVDVYDKIFKSLKKNILGQE